MVINQIVGVYISIKRIPIKGGMTIPNIATFDHGTYLNTPPLKDLKLENECIMGLLNAPPSQWINILDTHLPPKPFPSFPH